MSTVPADIIVDILSRLPVKSLLRFRCVSKPWCSLIHSPNFIKMHLNHSIEHNTNLSLILRCPHLYSVDFDTLDNAVELNHPLKSVDTETEVLSSCNGLLCLFNTKNDICLWNPSTRKHQMIPTMPIESPRAKCISTFYIFGFGYDSVNDEYKLVRMVQFDNKDFSIFCSEVRVYSLKTNSWRRVQDCPYYLHFNTYFDVLSNGAIHWVRRESDEELVAAFNLSLEEFEEVPQPDYLDKNFDMNLGVLGGCLCILCHYNRVSIDIWVMNEYGVKESWTKLFSVSEQEIGQRFVTLRPLAYSMDGKEVLLESYRTKNIWYDLEKKSVRNAQIRGIRNYMEANICVESLVPVNGGSRIDGMKQRAEEKKRKSNYNQKKKKKKKE